MKWGGGLWGIEVQKIRREGAVSQRKTHVDKDEVSEERAHFQSSIQPRTAQVILCRQV